MLKLIQPVQKLTRRRGNSKSQVRNPKPYDHYMPGRPYTL